MLKEITLIFRDVLDNNKIVITESSKASDVEDWDSLTHIELIIGIEKKFKIRFNTNEINSWANVGEMCAAIDKLLIV
jgi:acyl carrier protein